MYKQNNYTEISEPNLTYQKANSIVKNCVLEESNRINLLKFKIEEKFPLIHYIYSMLFRKIQRTNRTNNLEFKIKTILIFIFKLFKNRKTARAIAPKVVKQLPLPQANQITTEVLLTAKDLSNYQDTEVQINEQVPIDIKMSDDEFVSPTMVSVNNTLD